MNCTPLPPDFINRLRSRRPHDWDCIVKALQQAEPCLGLRTNTQKISSASLRQLLPFPLQEVPWCETGFIYEPGARPGLHPLFQAGLYYIQEPSAMFSVENLSVTPGMTVLDMCAAPGGKSTHILNKLCGEGLLVANEVVGKRLPALIHNLERNGSLNYVVTSAGAEEMAVLWPGFFDRILLDAPCSGEGMMRKDSYVRQTWSKAQVNHSSQVQRELLQAAYVMLKPGGKLLYSTCTFAEEENEWQIDDFVCRHDDVSVLNIEQGRGVEVDGKGYARLWPHRLDGEGHFCALLQKKGCSVHGAATPWDLKNHMTGAEEAAFTSFADLYLPGLDHTRVHSTDGNSVHLLPSRGLRTAGIRLARPGVLLGRHAGRVFVPAHSLALSLLPTAFETLDFFPEDTGLLAYLRGEALPATEKRANTWLKIACHGHTVGLGKQAGGRINNHLPKGLRMMG